MRRQARISAGGACIVRAASALQVWLWLLIFIFQNEFRISRSIQPGYLDFDNLPETNFTCTGKVIGGYYADLETSCQMFHVCTVGQQDEPMDIKFLCLNGTVFDQETRVCERVDEVDCTKSEKFYSLNLELYGSTTPPIIQPEEPKPQTQPTQQTYQATKPSTERQDVSINEASTISQDKTEIRIQESADSTEDPVQDIKKDVLKIPQMNIPVHIHFSSSEHDEFTEEYHEDDDPEGEYEDYPHVPTTTQTLHSTKIATSTTTTTTSRPLPSTTIIITSTSLRHQTPVSQQISSPSPVLSSLSPPLRPLAPTSATGLSAPSLEPTLLTPQEFVFRHRTPVSETVPYQTFRPADGVYITHAPPDQFDHFPYESSRTEPRPTISRPFANRPQPSPFRPTTNDPRNQILRPGPTSQPSERHETSVKHRQQNYPSALPEQRPLPFNPYYYDRKRSEDSVSENESSLSARSVAPPSVTERPPIKFKSPPRVIVTASASVSDSNGKRLNYTVGNVVSAVKPIVPINYDDYKESDLIFDPFFLDVPKLQKRRKTRSNHNRKVFTVPVTTTSASNVITERTTLASSPETTLATTTKSSLTTVSSTIATRTWNINDYVDDNYEPHAYVPPIPLSALLVSQNLKSNKKTDRQSINYLVESKTYRNSAKASLVEYSKPTTSTAQANSSHGLSEAHGSPDTSAPQPPLVEVSACVKSRSNDCRTRA